MPQRLEGETVERANAELHALPRIPLYTETISPERHALVSQRCAGSQSLKESLAANNAELIRAVNAKWHARARNDADADTLSNFSESLPEAFRFDGYENLSLYAASVPAGDQNVINPIRAEPRGYTSGPVLHISVYSRRHNTLTRHSVEDGGQPLDGDFVLTQCIEVAMSNTLADLVAEISCRNKDVPERCGWREEFASGEAPSAAPELWTTAEGTSDTANPIYPSFTGAMLDTDVCVMVQNTLYGKLPTCSSESYVRALIEHGQSEESPFHGVAAGGTLDTVSLGDLGQAVFAQPNWLLHMGDCEHRWTIDWIRDRAGDNIAFPRTLYLRRWMQSTLARQYLTPKKPVVRDKSRVLCDICAGMCDAVAAVVGGDQVQTSRLAGLPQMVTPMCAACLQAAVGADVSVALQCGATGAWCVVPLDPIGR